MKKIRKISLDGFDQLSVNESSRLYGGNDYIPTTPWVDVTPSVDITKVKITPPPAPATTTGGSSGKSGSSSGSKNNTITGSVKYDGPTDTYTGNVGYQGKTGNVSYGAEVSYDSKGNVSGNVKVGINF